MLRRVLLIVGLACSVVPTWGAPYWIDWEGDDWPENQGWERTVYGGGDQRWFEDGSLVLDGRASIDISDFYRRAAPSDPLPGEEFRVEWRLWVGDIPGFPDPAITVEAQEHGVVFLEYQETRIYSLFEGVYIDFAPRAFHDYVLRSEDMLSYSLYVDGAPAYNGVFVGSFPHSRLNWGDCTQGASSLSKWDYVRFGIVPEPSAGLLFGSAGLAVLVFRTRWAQGGAIVRRQP